MEPTHDQASPENLGTAAARKTTSRSAKAAGLNPDSQASATASADAGSTIGSTISGAQDALGSVVASGKKWLDDSHLLDQAGQVPQQAKALGQQALSRVGALSTTQKLVGISLLTAGIAFLATRSKRRENEESEYRSKPRRSPFEGKKPEAGYGRDRGEQRAWGSSPYGANSSSASGTRVSSGSGYGPDSQGSAVGASSQGSGQRRDQGPGRYDARTGGRQNPNNVDNEKLAF